MKKVQVLVLTCLTVAIGCPASFAALVITEVASTSGAPAGVLFDRDWWELTNTGPTSVLLDGYAWEDRPVENVRSGFPNNITIAVGESIIVHQGTDAATAATFRTDWGLSSSVQVLTEDMFSGANKFSGLSGTGGDDVHLFNAIPTEVAGVTFDIATAGVSFEWSGQGVNLGLSVNGENGAHTASNGRIGSPGVAVIPEPSSLALMLAGALGIWRRRH
jgi:hypothetical protein